MSDLISRTDAIACLSHGDGCGNSCRKRINALPSARPIGEWIEKEVFNIQESAIEEWQSARCSKCGKYHTTPYLYYFSNYKFCPCCGAEMVQGGDSE